MVSEKLCKVRLKWIITKVFIFSQFYHVIIIWTVKTAVDAGIIPMFTSLLSKRSYLEDLDTNAVILYLNETMQFSALLHVAGNAPISNDLQNIP